MTHFNDLDLRRWQQSGPGDDRERIVAHVAECPDCASKYAAAMKSFDGAAPADDVRDFVEAGHRIHARPKWIAPLAAAAVLVIAITIPLLMRRGQAPHEIHLRGNAIEALTPSGVVQAGNFEFTWASGINAAGYRLEIGRGDRVIALVDTQAPRMPAPPNLPPGDYWWRVSALDAAHRPLMTSQRVAFAVRSR